MPTPIGCAVCRRPLELPEHVVAAKTPGYVCLRCRGPRVAIPGYTIESYLGHGTSSTVFAARSAAGEPVAIKVYVGKPGFSPLTPKDFSEAAEHVRAIRHPNVLRVLEAGGDGRELYVVMERGRGSTLDHLLATRGLLPVGVVIRIGRQIASALEAARARDLVHGHLDPRRILVDDAGDAKLLGFLAAPPPPGAAVGDRAGFMHSPHAGLSLAYAPPEHLDNPANKTHASDLYGLGASLHFAFTGKPPFTAKSNMDYFMKIMKEQPAPLRELRPEVPAPVAAAVARCMMKNPDERFATAAELEAALAKAQ